jgi:exopolysaccharide production protein ExoZ
MPLYKSLQYLRAAAAILVLFFHASSHGDIGFTIGQAGVDIFFVISGFIMWSVTAARPTSPSTFVVQRLIRIVPAYWVVTLFMVVGAMAVPAFFPNLLTPPMHVALTLLFIPHASPYGTPFPILVPGWTLNYEMFFYALVAATLAVPGRSRAAVITVILGLLIAVGVFIQTDAVLVRTYTSPLMLEFVAGVWIGVFAHRLPGRRVSGVVALAGASAFAVQAGMHNIGDTWPILLWGEPGYWRALLWGVPAACIVAGVIGWERHGATRTSRIGLFLGAASYSIYLVHSIVIAAVWHFMRNQNLFAFAAVAIPAALGISLLFYVAIERPSTEALRRLLKGRSRKPQPQLASSK